MNDFQRDFEIDWANQLCEGSTLLRLELAGIDAAKVKDFAFRMWAAVRIRGLQVGIRKLDEVAA